MQETVLKPGQVDSLVSSISKLKRHFKEKYNGEPVGFVIFGSAFHVIVDGKLKESLGESAIKKLPRGI